MPSITAWTRLEPRTVLIEPKPALEARVHDAAWLLARQWQLGEFRGEDAGAPVAAAVTITRAPLAVPPDRPLDAVIAGTADVPDLRLRARAGLRLLDALDRANLHGRRQHYLDAAAFPPLETVADAGAADLIAIAGGRVPDGAQLIGVIAGELAAGVDTALGTVLADWLEWASPLLAPHADAWNPARLEYQVALAAAGTPALAATELRGAELDWYHVDVGVTNPTDPVAAATDEPIAPVPVPVRYPGMPATRFWQFEDDAVYFGGVEAGARDLGRMLFVELALVGADDWFVVPVPVTPGAVYTIKQLQITDSFGRPETIEPADTGPDGGPRWSMFRPALASGAAPAPALIVLPAATPVLADRPIEDLRLIRDEGANLAWGIERTIEGPLGEPIDLADRDLRDRPAAPPPSAELVYRVRTDVPPTYLPIVPRETARGSIELVRGRLAGAAVANPRGRMLAEITTLPETVLPRAGLRLLRRWRYARWSDGSIHVFCAREVELGAAAPASELAFDVIKPRE